MVQIIDPQNKYFKGRVVSRDDDKVLNNKSLNKIFHNDPSMAVIIDDREDVWRGPQSEHLLLVRPYAFFSPPVLREIGIGGPVLREANNGPGMLAATPINANIPSPVISLHESPGKVMQMVPQATMAYSEGDDQLPRCLQILRDLHARFFAQQAASNVATLLRDMRKDILRGCVLTFSGLIPMNEPRPEQHFLHRTATSLGATVTATLQPQTTHLVCINLQTAKAQAVMQQKRETQIFVVHPDWLVYCKWALARAQETSFLLTAVGPSIQPLSAAIVAPGGDNDAGEVAVKKRKLDESVLAQDNELALAAKRPHLGEATGTAVVASGEGAVVLVGDEEGGEAVVLPVDTAALADMDEAVGSCEVQNVSRTSTHPTEFIDLTLEDDGEDEDEVVPENLAVEDSEEEGDGDCRVYYDRHAVAHYADDDDDDDDLLARRHGDEDYSRYDSFNDDEDEEVVEEEGRGETVLRSPVPSDDDEDEALDLLAVHMRRQQAARRQNGTDSPSAADSSGDE